ncbi:MAG: hypothetical protein E6K81_12830 [Candidatus Eisenbacteria bacterium]|uniref:Uncharacterized protein n=1 Tax=Eiseniibacteriota bacterium TaxID=2212470 RepID=A0A538U3B8_UNCEI|nr:MAG: hypothetical protein E6K81_12830 [Candidatus Eisenbacteria bacterium]
MRKAPFVAPRLLLGAESLLGVSRGSRDRMLEIAARYTDPETLAVTLAKALAAGAEGVLASPSPQLKAALAELRQTVPIYALLPNVPQYVRDASDLGLMGTALKRVGRSGPLTLARLGLTGLGHLGAVLSGDLSGTVPLLLELEAAQLGATDIRAVVLAAPLTDLALAGRHRRFFERYCRFARRRFRAAGLETHNLGHLLARLREWKLRPDLVVGPVNPIGLMMKPDVAAVLAELRAAEFPVLAKELRAGGSVRLGEGARFARERGAYGVVADLVDVEDLTPEFKALSA